MGLTTMFHAKSTGLTPVVPAVGVYKEFIFNTPVTLELKEKGWSMSGDDFSIKDVATHKSLFKCSGKYMSMHDRKKMYDTHGKMLYNMAEKLIAIHKTITCESEHGKEVIKCKKKWSTGSKLKAEFVDWDDKEHTLELHGDMFGTSANITLSNGTNLAHISRKLVSATDMVADKQTYFVSCAPGIDVSLMAAVCICFDEVLNEKDD